MVKLRDQSHIGEAKKRYSHSLFESHSEPLLTAGRRALILKVLESGSATIDDVRAVVPIPMTANPKAFGAVPNALAKAGIIRRIGFVKSTRAIANARPISRWELADTAKAYAWLTAHPALETGVNQ